MREKIGRPHLGRNPVWIVVGLNFIISVALAQGQPAPKSGTENLYKPELVIQTGHTSLVNSVAFSPDQQIAASGAGDNLVKLWDVESGRQIRSLVGHTGWILSIAISPDGDTLASGALDNTVKLWSMRSGELIRTIRGHTGGLRTVAFSADGKLLASGAGDGDTMIRLWEVSTGELKKSLVGHRDDVFSVMFSPDSRSVASASTDGTVKLWGVADGNLIKTLEGHTDEVLSVAFSPDGNVLASGGKDNVIRLWDVSSGAQMRTFEGHTSFIYSIIFSHDGKTLASGAGDKTIKLWSVATGELIRSLEGHKRLVKSISLSRDGNTLLSGSSDNTLRLWNVRTGEEMKSFEGHTTHVVSVATSRDGKKLASASFSGQIKLWNLENGEQGRLFKYDPKTDYSIRTIAFSSDGITLASGGVDNRVDLWDTETGLLLRSFEGHGSIVNSVQFSPDGATLVSGSADGTIRIWNVAGEREEPKILTAHAKGVNAITFAPDSMTVASGGKDGTIKLWDAKTGEQITLLAGHVGEVSSIQFSPDGSTLASAGFDRMVMLWNVATGQSRSLSGHTDKVNSVAFMQDGKILASGSDDRTIKLWNVATGLLTTSLGGHTDRVLCVAFASNKEFLVSSSWDATVKLWRFEKAQAIATLISLNRDDWVVVDDDGRFDASAGAQKLMHFVLGFETIDLEQVKDRYYTPNLLRRIYKGENLDASRKVAVFTANELYPFVEYTPLKPNEKVLTVKLKNRGGGIGRIQVIVNGSEFLADARPKGLDPNSEVADISIDFTSAKTLKSGEGNDIRVIARNQAGWLKNRGAEIVYLDQRKKDETPQEFYAIVGGVSEYENSDFNLRYSAKDARDFARAVELGAVKLFGRDKVHIRLLASGAENEAATLSGGDSKQLTPSKDNFRSAFEEFRKAKPTDVFVVYLAGHGTSINRGGDTGDTYLYLTREAVTTDKSRLLDDKLRNATTISSEELAEWIKDVPALKRAMILDTCAAGAVEASLIKPRDLSPDQIKALDRMKDRTGFYVLMGSAADAQSYEATRYGQGLLTYSLLQGMSGAKLRNGEYADVSSLFNYAEDTVTEMAKGIGGIQQPRIIAPTESRSFDIGQFSAAEKGKFTLAKVKPLILQPQLSNDKLKFDNLKLSQMVAKALRDESSTISRGDAEAKLVFVDAEEMTDALTPGGVYEVNGNRITVTLILVKNNEPVKTITVEGTSEDKEELSRKIVRAIIEYAG